jgi:ABC-type sugar transport system ATPase subunit
MNFLPPTSLLWPTGPANLVGIRPEDVRHVTENPLLTGAVEHCERLGEVTIAHLRLPDGQGFLAKLPGDAAVAPDTPIALAVDPKRLHRFDAQGLRIGD